LTSSPLTQHSLKKKPWPRGLGGRGPGRLAKETSNLFRDREAAPRRRLDVRAFNQVLAVDAAAAGWTPRA